ncbi:MAG TPA: class I SAM-dependent methyltransferase [Planctomycetota bacterium]|nr:class I SAM-dependent methyltransferase [Planctomycetota bacterium]
MSAPDAGPSLAPRTEPALGARAVRVDCPLCGERRPRLYRRGMYAIGRERYDLVRCPCGAVYVDPRPDPAAMSRLYGDPAYYTEGYNLGVETENYFERRDELLAQYDGEVARLEREAGRGSSRGDLLELGSAGGFFLEAARRRGWRVRGIEIAAAAAEYSRRELGLDVFQGELAQAPFERGSFDLAVADNVLEHTERPGEVLARLRELLRPGGHLLVIVPSYVNSPWFRALDAARRAVPRALLGRQLVRILKLDPEGDPGLPYHLLEFDRKTLVDLFRRERFEIVEVEASLPLPSHLFKTAGAGPRVRLLRGVFRTLDFLMRRGVLPGARLRVLARAPSA